MKVMKRLMAIALTLCMLASMLPTTAFAAIDDMGDWGGGEEGLGCPMCGDPACPGCGGSGMCPMCSMPNCLTCMGCHNCGTGDPMCPEGGMQGGCMYCGDPACMGECMIHIGICGENVEFELDETTGNLRIYGYGDMYDEFQEWSGYYINSVHIDEGITSISSYAFAGHYDIQMITIPATVTRIGDYAFQDCYVYNVEYYGSPSQWSAISVGEGNAWLYKATLTCYGEDEIEIDESLYDLIVADPATYPESDHNYANNLNDYKEFSYPGAEYLKVTFSSSTETESNCDMLYLYDSEGNLIKEYTGTQAKGKTVFIPGSGFKIRLYSDSSVQKYGYAFDSIVALVPKSEGIGGTCGENLTWTLEEETGTLTISGTGSMESWTSGSAPWYDYADSITKIVIEAGVQSLGNYAFADFTNLVEIVLPEGLTSIGIKVFYNCTNIVNITIPESVTDIGDGAFSGCSSLVEIVIPEGVTHIGIELFYNCTNIINITIPESVESIGDSAFEGCTSLVEIVIPEGVTSIGVEVFYNCTNIINITIPEGVTSIGDGAFKGCTSLVEIVIPEGVTSIGVEVFYNCTNIVNITIPEGVTNIGDGAFKGCTSLVEIVIPDSVEHIGVEVFYNCTNIINITIPEGVESIGDSAFAGCSSLVKVILPDSLTHIGIKVFYNCTNIVNITIPDSVTSIGNNAFNGCSSLVKIVIPEGVTNIGVKVFYNCTNLINITIPKSVENVGEGAFSGCEKLETVNYGGTEDQWKDIHVESDNDALGSAEKQLILGNGICGENLTWLLDREGTLTISGTGDMEIWDSTITPWDEFTASIVCAIVEDGVTSISDFAFANCSALTQVTIPASVVSIGNSALINCYSLKRIAVDENNTAYCSDDKGVLFNKEKTVLMVAPCSGLVGSYEIPESVTEIKANAFAGSKVTGVSLPENLSLIGISAFYKCENLQSIIIPDSVTEIGRAAFYNCTSLQSVTLGSGVTVINSNVFKDCRALSKLTMHDGITSIGKYAFENCSALTRVTIPANITQIGDAAFAGCSGLKTAYYGKAAQQWAEVSIGEENEFLTNAKIYFPETLVTGIAVNTQPTKTEYWIGEALDATGLTLIATYQDGHTATITNGFTVTGIDSGTEGKKTVTVTYEEKTATFEVTVKKPVVTELTVATMPNKTQYWTEEHLDTTGLTLTAKYSNGSIETVTEGFSAAGFSSALAGEKTVTVRYKEGVTTFTVTVKAPELVSIAVASMPSKTNYWVGEELNTNGLTLTASYSNGTEKIIRSGFTVSGFESETVGEKTVTVTYEEKTATFTVNVIVPVLTGISVYTLPNKTGYWVGEALETDGLTLLATYSDGRTKTITEGFQVSGFESETEGVKTLTVTYEDKATTLDVTVIIPVLTSIAVKEMPLQTSFWIGQSLNTTGLSICATYNDGRKVILTEGFTLSGYENTTPGEKTITITYEEKTTEFKVLVKEPVLVGIEIHESTKKEYWLGESQQNSDIVLYARYSDGSSKRVWNDFTVTGFDSENPGARVITVTYQEKTAYVTVTIKVPVLTEIEVYTPSIQKTEYAIGEELDITGLTLAGIYSDGSTATITEGFTVSGFDSTTAGEKTLTITYKEMTTTFTVTVKQNVTRITVGKVTKTEYWIGEELDTTGLLVTAYYADGSSQVITEGYTISGFDSTTAGKKAVKVTYAGFTVTFANVTILSEVSGECGASATWTLDSKGTLTISGTGPMYNWANLNTPWQKYNLNIKKIVVANEITRIGNGAFRGCSNLIEVEIPNTVNRIGDGAFYNCRSLTGASIPDSVTSLGEAVFAYCDSMTSVTVSSGITVISDSVFLLCTNLSTVNIRGNVTKIGNRAFESCVSLASITLPRSIADVGNGAFYGCNSLTDVYYKGSQTQWDNIVVDRNNDSLTKATLYITQGAVASGKCGASVTWALYDDGELVFSGSKGMYNWANVKTPWNDYNSSITKVTIEEGITYIGKSAFRNCTNLVSIQIPSTVTSVGAGAFDTTTALKSVLFGASAPQWASVSIGSDNDLLTKATMKYTLAEIVSGKCGGNIYWKLYNSGELTLTGTKGMYDWANRDTPWNAYSDIITKVVIEDGITYIGKSAFRNCTKLTSIQIPKSVVTIGIGAFETATSLKTITYVGTQAQWEEVTVNSSNDPLINAVVTAKLTEIASGSCGGAVTWTLYNNGELAFTGTKGTYDWANRDTPWNNYVSSIKTVTVGEGITYIGKSVFRNCSKLTDIRLPSTLTSIGLGAFETTKALRNITYTDTIAQWAKITVGENNDCLSNVAIACTDGKIIRGVAGEAVTWELDSNGVLIFSGTGTMYNWANLETPWSGHLESITKVVVGNGIQRIGDGAFRGCSNLSEVEIPDTVNRIGDGAFRYCSSLKSVNIPDSVTSLGDFAFSFCRNLTSVQIGTGVTTIGDSVFSLCESLTNVTILGAITKIGNSTFEGCTSLLNITIPGSVKSIGVAAFGHCDNLSDVYFDGASRQWMEVAIADYNETLTSAKITFKYCDHLEIENGVCTGCGVTIGAVITDSEGNVIGNFATLTDALAAATEGQTLALQADVTAEDLILADGVSLDLNGNTLTADSVLTYTSSAIVDSSEDVSGLLKITEADGNMISQFNSQLPVYDSEDGGYRFFAIDVTPYAVTGRKSGTPKYWFKIKAEKFAPLYDLICEGADVQIKVKMTWDGQTEDTYASANLAFTRAWADSYNANEDVYITVSVADAQNLENFKLIPMITSNDVVISGEEM